MGYFGSADRKQEDDNYYHKLFISDISSEASLVKYIKDNEKDLIKSQAWEITTVLESILDSYGKSTYYLRRFGKKDYVICFGKILYENQA